MQLLDRRLEPGVVERREVERAHLVAVRDEPPRQVQAEEARAARDRPQHGRTYPSACPGAGLRPLGCSLGSRPRRPPAFGRPGRPPLARARRVTRCEVVDPNRDGRSASRRELDVLRAVRRLRRSIRDRRRGGRLPALALGRHRLPAHRRLARAARSGGSCELGRARPRAVRDPAPPALKVAFVPLLIGSYSPDMMTKWFVYGIHLGPGT